MSMNNLHILVIDDSPDVRLLARKILEGEGARVSDASSYETGMAEATKAVPHLIILDLGLPDKSGFDFLAAKKDLPALKDVPVVILSGKKDKASVTEAIGLGAKDYILKPFRAALLLQKARKNLRLTSFLSKSLPVEERAKATFSLAAEMLEISEGGCLIEAPVKLGAQDAVRLTSEVLQSLGLQDVTTRVSKNPAKYASPGRYVNEVNFVGMDDNRAKRIRQFLKGGP